MWNSGGNWLEGGAGDTIYVYNRDCDHDFIYNGNSDPGDINELYFGPGITLEDLTFFREGNDLYISIADDSGEETGSVTVVDWYLGDIYKLARIVFHDGTELTAEEIEALVTRVVRGTTGNQTLRTLSLPGERVRLYAVGGVNFLVGGHGTDTFVIGTGHDNIAARSNMEGGGQKVFVWNVGAGDATIHYFNGNRQAKGDELSILQFGPGVAPENVDVQISANNVVFAITVEGRESRIEFMGARHDIRAQMDEIRFADGTVLTWNEALGSRIVRGTDRNETLRTLSLPGERVRLYAVGGVNSLVGGHGTDTFVIGTGHDTIAARSNVEGGGQKVFVWNVGAGDATIHYFNGNRQAKGDELSILQFGPGVAPENIDVQISGNNVVFVIIVGDVESRITFMGARHDIRAQMDRIQFDDRTSHAWSDFVEQ